MRKRWCALVALILCAGCSMFAARAPDAREAAGVMNMPAIPGPSSALIPPTTPATEVPAVRPVSHQVATRGAEELQSASDCLERGDEPGAAAHLLAYVEANPHHAVVRVHLAELLMRQSRPTEAKRHFAAYVGQAQEQGDPANRHMVLSHTRLSEIAHGEQDSYAEQLHRGIGLWLLACQVQKVSNPDSDTPDPQQLLFKAVRALNQAVCIRPDEARPHWYLYEVWLMLGQRHPAARSLEQARERGWLADLTTTERQGLALAK